MEHEYLRLRRDKHYSPVSVDINGRVVTELDVSILSYPLIICINYHFTFVTYTNLQQFSGSTHATKPSDDPKSKVPTPDEFAAGFKTFVEASFCVADQLAMH